MALRVSKDTFEQEVLHADKPVLVEFYSDSCIPCKKIAAVLGELEDLYEDKIYVKKVNVNFEEGLVEQYRVMSSPTVILFNRGKEEKRLSGAEKKGNAGSIISGFNQIKARDRNMNIKIAGNKKEFLDGITVARLIELEEVENPEYVTVTLNDEFVERGQFEATELKDGDEVEFLYFMGGGSL